MKTHTQIETKVIDEQNEFFGGANCPYCGERCSLTAKSNFIFLDKNKCCDHANSAIDAGGFKTAIHFEKTWS